MVSGEDMILVLKLATDPNIELLWLIDDECLGVIL